MLVAILGFFGALASVVFWLVVLWILNRMEPSWSFSRDPDWSIYGPQRRIALERDGYRCRMCGCPAHITHHITPRRYGGSDMANNLMTVCPSCHRKVEPP